MSAVAAYRDMRHLVVPVYAPAFLATLAQKVVIAALPLYVKDGLQGDDAAVGAITSMQGLGAFATAALAGYLISLVGDRCGMIAGAIASCLAYFACLLVTTLPTTQAAMALLACACFATGIGKATFEVARNSYMACNVPKSLRGRANGLIGGCARVASMVGPALGGLVMHYHGSDGSAVFVAQVLIGAAAVGLLVIGVSPASSVPVPSSQTQQDMVATAEGAELSNSGASDGSARNANCKCVASLARSDSDPTQRRCEFATSIVLLPLLEAGPTGFSFGFVRAARGLLIPLKADAIELSASAVGYVTAASFACDSLLFPLGGHISDRYGRKAAGVPALMIMATGCLLLGLARGVWGVSSASALIGVGNALSSGIVQTVGQDAAPSDPRARSHFLGLYKVATDCGTFLGPLVVGLVANAVGLDAAAEVVAVATCACALWYAAISKESMRHGPTKSRTCRDGDERSAHAELIPSQTAVVAVVGRTPSTPDLCRA